MSLHGGECRRFLDNLDGEELRSIKVAIRRNDIAPTDDPSPLRRRLENPEKIKLHLSSVAGRKLFWREDVHPNLCRLEDEYFGPQKKSWSIDPNCPSSSSNNHTSKTSKTAPFGGNYIKTAPGIRLPGEEESRRSKTSYNIEYARRQRSNSRRDSISPKRHRSSSKSPTYKRKKESTYIPDRSSRGSRSPRRESRRKSPSPPRYKRRSPTRSRSRSRHSRSRSKEPKRTRSVRRSRSLTPLRPGEYRPGYPRRTSPKERRTTPPPESDRREKRRSRSPRSHDYRRRRSNSPSYHHHRGFPGYPAAPPQTYAIIVPNFPGGWPERPMGPVPDFIPIFPPFPYAAHRPRLPIVRPHMIRPPIQYNNRPIPKLIGTTTATVTSTSATVSEAASSSQQQSSVVTNDENKID